MSCNASRNHREKTMMAAMKSTLAERLQEAANAGEIISIVCRDGLRPETVCRITPLSIQGVNVRALCLTSGTVRTFKLDSIAISNNSGRWQPGMPRTARYMSIADLYRQHAEVLVGMGWIVPVSDTTLALHGKNEDGTPEKQPVVSLRYTEFTWDTAIGSAGEDIRENIRKHKQPWSVSGRGKIVRSTGSLNQAAAILLDWASELAPGCEPDSRGNP